MAKDKVPVPDDAATPAAPEAPPAPVLTPEVMALFGQFAKTLSDAQVAGAAAIQQANGPRDNPMGSPMVSVYNPKGDRDHPREDLRCPMTFVGYDVERDALKPHELTLLNLIEPGRYRVKKTDGSYAVMAVIPEYDTASQSLIKMSITIPVKDKSGMARQNWPSMGELLAQAMGLPYEPEAPSLDLPLGKMHGPSGGALGMPAGMTRHESNEDFLASERNPMIRRDVTNFFANTPA